MMQIQLKTLLASSLLVLTALSASAEQPMYYGPQGGMGQVPIAWGDCVPVPVNSIPVEMNSMPPFPPAQGMMLPPQNYMPVFMAPPPSPFFNGTAPAPMPPQAVMPSCNNDKKLQALQLHYKKAASASKMKIQEMVFMLDDAKSQLANVSRDRNTLEQRLAELNSAEKSNEKKNRNEALELKKKLHDLDNTNKSLLTKIKLIERDAGAQARKLTALEQSAKEFKALQSAYKERNDENANLKKQLASLDDNNKTLKMKLGSLETESGSQARKITALGQSATELSALQSAYRERNDENVSLKEKLASLDNENKTLKMKLGSLETESGSQARKITALGQSATELTALQSAYKERNDENASLKEQLASLDDKNKTLKMKLGTLEAESGSQARKITALGQSETELTALQSAYKERNDENVNLKAQIIMLEGEISDQKKAYTEATITIDTLHAMRSDFEKEKTGLDYELALANTDTDKDGVFDPSDTCPETAEGTIVNIQGCADERVTLLATTSDELTALKASYGELLRQKNDLNHELIIATSDDDKDGVVNPSDTCPASADGAIVNIKGCDDDRVALFTSTSDELTALKASYGDLLRQKTDLNHELIMATSDDDKDGVVNPSDTCPTSASGSIVNIKGCDDDRVALLSATTDELAALKATYGDLLRQKNTLNHDLIIATSDDDKDGVVNPSDKCPTTSQGVAVNITGCAADSDNDGVTDSKDRCPASPAGSSVNAEGCPKMKDSDADGVADANDLCANTAQGTKVNAFGCTATDNITLKGVNFNTGSANLTSASLPILDTAADTLRNASNPRVEIAGYTDNQGSAVLNKRLSQRRANAVMIYLIKKGIDARSLSATGYGEANPVASNKTKTGRATNRRVELKMK